jgi:hypothetical protein
MAVARLELQVDDKGTIKVKQLGEELKKTGEEAKHAHEGMAAIFQGIGIEAGMKIFEALHAAVEALPEFIMSATEHVAELAHELELLQARTGMSTDYLQKLRFMAAATGVDMGAVASAVNKFQKGIEEGSPKVVAALGKLGLSLQQLGKMSADQQFQAVIDRLGKIEQPALRSQIAIALLGKSGAALLPLILGAGDLSKKFEELGIKLDETAVKAGAQLGGEMKLLTAVFEGFKNQIGSVITTSPALHAMLQGVIQLVGQMATWVGKNRAELTSLVDQGLIYMVHGLGMVVEGIGAFVYAIGRSITLYYEAKAGALGFVSALYELEAVLARKTGFTEHANEMDRLAASALKDANVAKAAAQSWAEATEKANEKVDVVSKALHTMGVAMEDAHDKGMKFKDSEEAVAAGAGEDAEAVKRAAEEVKKASEEFDKLAEAAQKAADVAEAKGLGGLAGELAKIDVETNAAIDKVIQLGIEGNKTDTAIAAVIANLTRAGDAAKRAAIDKEMQRIVQETMRAEEAFDKLTLSITRSLARQGKSDLQAQMEAIDAETQATSDELLQLGLAAGVGLSTIYEWINKVAAAAERAKKVLYWQDLANKFGEVGDSLSALDELFDELGVSADSSLRKAVQGMQDLAKAGQGVATMMAGFAERGFTGIVTGITAGLGALKSLISGIKKLFGGDPMKEVGRVAGNVLGMSLSHSLLETISKTAKDLGISVATAALLHLTDALKETGKAASGAIPQMMQLFAIAKQGGAVGAAAVDELGKAFTMLKTEAEAGSAAAARGMVQLIQEARKAGQVIPEIAAAVSKAMEDALSGLADFTKNFKITSPEDARAEAFIFASTFWAEVQEKGEVAAATAMLPAWQAMQDSLKAAGIDPAVVAEILAPMQAVFDALADDGIKKVIEGLDGASRAVKGLADAGYMTQGAFQGLEQVAGSSVDQIAQDLIGKGVPAADAQRQALQLCAPQLAQLAQLSQQYGIKLDANTQSLIDQAAAAGIAFPTDPLMQVISLLQQIADKLGAIPRDTQANVNVHTTYTRSGTPPPGGGGEGGGDDNGTLSTGEGKGAGWEGAPRAASGLVVEPRLGGSHVVLGEGGSRELAGPSTRWPGRSAPAWRCSCRREAAGDRPSRSRSTSMRAARWTRPRSRPRAPRRAGRDPRNSGAHKATRVRRFLMGGALMADVTPRFLYDNRAIVSGTVLTASSQDPANPKRRLFDPCPSVGWRSPVGWNVVFNFNAAIRVRVGVTDYQASIAEGSYQTPSTYAAAVQTALNAMPDRAHVDRQLQRSHVQVHDQRFGRLHRARKSDGWRDRQRAWRPGIPVERLGQRRDTTSAVCGVQEPRISQLRPRHRDVSRRGDRARPQHGQRRNRHPLQVGHVPRDRRDARRDARRGRPLIQAGRVLQRGKRPLMGAGDRGPEHEHVRLHRDRHRIRRSLLATRALNRSGLPAEGPSSLDDLALDRRSRLQVQAQPSEAIHGHVQSPIARRRCRI